MRYMSHRHCETQYTYMDTDSFPAFLLHGALCLHVYSRWTVKLVPGTSLIGWDVIFFDGLPAVCNEFGSRNQFAGQGLYTAAGL